MAAVEMLLDLLPRGPAWARDASSTLRKLLEAFGAELDRVEERIADALVEAIPSSATELLEDFVALAELTGLGDLDPDGPAGPLVVARRHLRAHMTSRPLTRSRLRELCAIESETGTYCELVSAEVTDTDEVTITLAEATPAELRDWAEAEAHAIGSLVWGGTLDLVASEVDGITPVGNELAGDSVAQEAP